MKTFGKGFLLAILLVGVSGVGHGDDYYGFLKYYVDNDVSGLEKRLGAYLKINLDNDFFVVQYA